jgi:eukaryotic-like serine/threonine-protein kinase
MKAGIRHATASTGGLETVCPSDATLAEFIDGTLDLATRSGALQHLASCATCRRLISDLTRGRTGDAALQGDHALVERDDDASARLAPGARMGRYTVLHRAGSGTAGVVYAAYDPDLDRRVAIKLLRATGQDPRFLREARALAQLSHPNVMAVYDVGVFEGRVFIAMEYIAEGTLRGWLSAEPRTPAQIVDVFRDAGRGLAAAHDAGLVHRDFKPDNVLCGQGHRILVTDFGLVRQALTASGETGSSTSHLVGALGESRTGELAGTPAYMAPELFEGAVGDRRSDQFAFSVSLFEALYGTRPFQGDTIRDLADDMLRGKPREPESQASVPLAVRRAVLRGLSRDPAARFPSMHEMVAALLGPRQRSRWVLGGAALATLLLAGGAALGARVRPAPPAALCGGGAEKVATFWGAAQQATVREAFEATRQPYAADAWRTFERGMNEFAKSYDAAYRDACEATRLRGEQSEELLDKRMLCLELRRKEAGALASAYSHADAQRVARVPQALGNLSAPIPSCTAAAVNETAPVPRDPEARAKIQSLQDELARIDGLGEEGQLQEALHAAEAAASAAKELGYAPLEAEARSRLAHYHRELRTSEQQGRAVEAALRSEAARMDRLAILNWILLIRVATDQSKMDEARLYNRLAEAGIDRIGGDEELSAKRLADYGWLLRAAGKMEEALQAVSPAVLWREAHPSDAYALAQALLIRSVTYIGLGRLTESLEDIRRGEAVVERAFGPNAPQRASFVVDLGQSLVRLGRYDEAIEVLERALPIVKASYDKTPMMALAYMSLAAALFHEERFLEAKGYMAQASASLGTSPNAIAYAELFSGEVSFGQRDLADAEQRAKKALLLAGANGWQDLEVEARNLLARVARARRRIDDAVNVQRQSVASAERLPDRLHLSEGLPLYAELLMEKGDLTEAREVAERAVSLVEPLQPDVDPHNLADARFVLAKVLDKQKTESDRARSLALHAQAEYAKNGTNGTPRKAEIDAWLAKHGGSLP